MKFSMTLITSLITISMLVWGQTPPVAATPSPVPPKTGATAPKPVGAPKPAQTAVKPVVYSAEVQNLLGMLKVLSEEQMIRRIQRDNAAYKFTGAEWGALKEGGATPKILDALVDSGTAPKEQAKQEQAKQEPAPPTPPQPVPSPVVQQQAVTNPVPPPSASTPMVPPPPSPAPDPNASKKRVIVDAFDYAAVKTAVQAIFGSEQNIGKGIQSMLTVRVQKANNLIVVDRANLERLKVEMLLGQSNGSKPGKGARMGRISTADLFLTGDIVVFGRDDRQTKVGAGAITRYCGSICAGAELMWKKDKAVVVINYRLIDVETTENIAAGEARGESSRKSNSWAGLLGKWGKAAGASFDMTSKNFAETIIGEATQNAVDKLASILTEQSANMKKRVREVDAPVAVVEGNIITLGRGEDDGINVGEIFDVLHVDKDVIDPDTKEVLDRVTTPVGEMRITEVRQRISRGVYSGPPVTGGKDYIGRKRIQ